MTEENRRTWKETSLMATLSTTDHPLTDMKSGALLVSVRWRSWRRHQIKVRVVLLTTAVFFSSFSIKNFSQSQTFERRAQSYILTPHGWLFAGNFKYTLQTFTIVKTKMWYGMGCETDWSSKYKRPTLIHWKTILISWRCAKR